MKASLVYLLFFLTALPARADGLAEHPEVAPRLALYATWAGEQMAYRHQPGVVVGIVHEGELVWARGFGVRDVESGLPATSETAFRIGSVTKLLTATAAAQLWERGALRLDDPASAHLPWLAGRAPGGPPITVRQLLTHTSGLPREAAFPYWTDRRFPSRERMIAALADQESDFGPGERYQYSNLGLALLGEVVAAVAGMPWEDYVTRHVLEPLGMTSTTLRWADLDRERLATGYLLGGLEAPPTDSQALAPAADASSTVADLARFLAAHLTGRPPILAPWTRREMHRVHWLDEGWTSGRGLGFSVWRRGERTLVGHGGWVAGYRSQVAFDRGSRFGVVVLTNSDEGGPGVYLDQAFDFVVPAMEKAVRPAPAPPAVADPGRFAGSYHNPWGEVTDVLVVGGGLATYERTYPPASDLGSRLTELTPDGEHAFRKPDGGERVVFELRPDGRVARVKVGENYLFPEDCGRIGEDLRCTWE
jgi:CubicO group peptidase (beta-lactamase class C family)